MQETAFARNFLEGTLMRKSFILALFLIVASMATATTPVTPTTTLTAETSNNTSTANSFSGMANGNVGASNISKVSLKTMMYPGFNGKMYAHLMGWFGPSNHYNVGYSSNTSAQVASQVNDMQSRGFDGLILDWYGPSHGIEDQVAQLLLTEVPKHTNFTWAVMEDVGAIKTCANTSGCDVTAKLINDLTYAYNNYEQSPSYIKINGRPIIPFFGIETISGIDWTRVSASVPGNPIYIWRNAGGFSKSLSGGSFAWVNINKTDPTDIALSYLDNFYSTSLNYLSKTTLATGYKGFDDSAASWGANKLMYQNCGQTWLKSMAETGKYYNSSTNVYGVQIATWNDYEEGTEIESGIDNCLSISASMTGSSQLNWTISGNENTLDHYTVFISPDGQNLMSVAEVPTGTRSLDLSQYSFDPATYSVYVKAVGKPTILNHMSAAVNYSIANQAPIAMLAATPSSGIAPVTVSATTSGSYDNDGSIASTTINWGDGTSILAANGSHSYTTPGNYTIMATVTDNLGASATASQALTVAANKAPVAMLSVTPATGTAPVSVTASTSGSYDSDGSIASTVINWGDGTSTVAASGAHTYSNAGSYTVTATVTDNLGASSTANATVSASAPVVKVPGGVTVSSPTPNSTVNPSVHFVASGTASTGASVTGMKIYIDSTSKYSTTAASINTYLTLTKGSHAIVVKAWDSTGAVYSSSMTIRVK
jgi:PKD repeat protein